MNMKKLIWFAIGIVVIIIVASSLNNRTRSADTSLQRKDPVRIGVVNSLTSFAAMWGEFAKKGADLAVKQINSQGGLNGRQIQLITEDDHTDAKNSVTAYKKLTSVDMVDGIIGGVFDFSARAIMPLAETDKIALITPQNFRIPGALEPGSQSFVMMTDFGTVLEKLKLFIAESKAKKIAVVHFTSAWGAEIAKVVGSISNELGKGKIVDESYQSLGNNDFKTTISKLKSAGVDLVFIDMFGNDTKSFLTRSKEQGYRPVIITYNGALDGVENTNGILEDIVVLNWEISSPAFEELFKKEYGEAPQKSAEKWFDAVYAMANGIANSTSTSSIADYIATHSITTPNSTVAFTSVHTVAEIPVEIMTIKNGSLVPWKK